MSNFELHFELEPNCILVCKHCSSQAIKKEVLQFNREDVLRLVKAVNPLEIYFTGGEPLLFPDLLLLFSEISSQFPECKLGLFTTGIIQNNGCLVPVGLDTLTELYQSGLRTCYVSLYSDEENWHDYMTGTEGSFKKTVQAIKNMHIAGIDVRINLVVTRFNSSRIRNIIDFVSDLNVSEVRLLKLIQHGNATDYWDTIGISDQEYFEAITSTYSCRKELGTRITFSSIPKLAPCRPIEHSCGCQARKKLLYVTLSGNIYPCACVKNDPTFLICNLKDEYLEELVSINLDKKLYYNSCLAERDNRLMDFNNAFSELFLHYFSDIPFISKSTAVAANIKDFLHDMKEYASGIDFFELMFKMNQPHCLYYEIHAFFLKENIEKGEAVCFIASGLDFGQVHSVCEKKYPNLQIQYQIINSAFIDHYIKEELLKRLVSTFDSLAFNPENYLFVKECVGL